MASFNARAAATVEAHFGSHFRAPARASSVKALSTRRVAAGDQVTRWTHSDRSCSVTVTRSTTSTATAPLPAALRFRTPRVGRPASTRSPGDLDPSAAPETCSVGTGSQTPWWACPRLRFSYGRNTWST